MVQDINHSEDTAEVIAPLPSQQTWLEGVCGYFQDFLDTDFRKTRAPKRQISARDKMGLLTGVAISKYPELSRDLWELMLVPFDSSMTHELSVRRGKYQSRISERLRDLINKHINSISEEQINAVVDGLKAYAREQRVKLADDPERFADQVLAQVKLELLNTAVNPLLGSLDNFFKGQGNESFG